MNKFELRKLYLEKIASLNKEKRGNASHQACHFLIQKLEGVGLVGSYFPLNSEINLSYFNQVLIDQKRLALPRVEENEIVFYRVSKLNQDLEKSTLNIYEPHPAPNTRLSANELAFLLVPGLAYDTEHNRLGRGKGFYDRFLARSHSYCSIAVAFNIQKHEEPLPIEDHDQPIDEIYYF